MKKISKTNSIVLILILVLIIFAWLYFLRQSPTQAASKPMTMEKSASKKPKLPTVPHYVARPFNIGGSIPGLSTKQIDEHDQLYRGYVAKRNLIAERLQTVDRANLSKTYAPFRELKVEETYAVNGMILHELYFENMNKKPSEVGAQMKALIEESFGSFQAYKDDFFDCGKSARGWVITAYSFDDHLLHNFVLEQHNMNVPVLIFPLVVLDVYEHAYMIDYGIKLDPYLETFWKAIDWSVVENRIQKWVKKIP